MEKPVHVDFVLLPGFSLLALSCAVDALRAANLVLGRTAYAWRLAADLDDSAAGDGVPSSSLIRLPATPLERGCAVPDLIAVVGGERSHRYRSAALAGSLTRAAGRGARIGSISDGAFPVAAAGTVRRLPLDDSLEMPGRLQGAVSPPRYPHLHLRGRPRPVQLRRRYCQPGPHADLRHGGSWRGDRVIGGGKLRSRPDSRSGAGAARGPPSAWPAGTGMSPKPSCSWSDTWRTRSPWVGSPGRSAFRLASSRACSMAGCGVRRGGSIWICGSTAPPACSARPA